MRTRWPRIAGIIAIVALLAVGLVLLFWPTARELAEVAVERGEIQLRDPLRPIRDTTRVLVVALDGVSDADLRWAIRAGHLPVVSRLVGREVQDDVFEHAHAVPEVVSVLPSSTFSAWASVFTGEPPGRTGIPGNEWYVREERRFYAPGPTSIGDHLDVVRMFTEDIFGAMIPVPTLFERVDVRAHVAMMPIFRGADLLLVPSLRHAAELFGRVATGLPDEDIVERELYATMDEAVAERALRAIAEHGLPDLQVVYFSGVDLYTHLAEPPLPQMHRYLHDIIDPAIGRIVSRYAELDALDDTFIVFVADHGHTPVLKDDRHALATDPNRDPPAVVTRAGYRVRPFTLDVEDDKRDYQVVLAYEGAFARIHVADRSTCHEAGDHCDWLRPPRLHEDVLPLAMAFDRANRYGELVPELQNTLDLIFVREPVALDEAPRPFRVWDGRRAVPVGDYLREHPRPDLLRLEERLTGLATGPHGHRAGDILLLARSGMNRSLDERFYFSSRNHSWHGGPEAQDSQIPLLVVHPRYSGHELRRMVQRVVGPEPSQLDVLPLIEILLAEEDR